VVAVDNVAARGAEEQRDGDGEDSRNGYIRLRRRPVSAVNHCRSR